MYAADGHSTGHERGALQHEDAFIFGKASTVVSPWRKDLFSLHEDVTAAR